MGSIKVNSFDVKIWNKTRLALWLMWVCPAICFGQYSNAYNEAQSMLNEKNYFKARDYIMDHGNELSPAENLIMKANVASAFNQPGASNKALKLFWQRYLKGAPDTVRLELLKLRQNNYARLFEYAEAYKISQQLLSKYSKHLSPADYADISNTAVIWKSLAGCPKQHISITGDTFIKMKRDRAKLANIAVQSNETAADFIFDTGANFCTVTESTAKAFNMRRLKGKVEIGAVTGAKVLSGLAICPVFSMGNVMVKNAVFLVLPDTALAFPQIKYQINGIIGFPVIEGLKEIQILRNDELIVPKRASSSALKNMALEFLTPIYQINDEYYTFDTGATNTMLYRKYLEKHKNEILEENLLQDLKFGGAGGAVTKKGYKINFRTVISGKTIDLKNVEVFSNYINDSKDHFYGNIGQDLIKEFDKMTINFRRCSFYLNK